MLSRVQISFVIPWSVLYINSSIFSLPKIIYFNYLLKNTEYVIKYVFRQSYNSRVSVDVCCSLIRQSVCYRRREYSILPGRLYVVKSESICV